MNLSHSNHKPKSYNKNQKDKIVKHKKYTRENSLVVQWLRLCIPNTGGLGLISGQGTISGMLQLRLSAAK